MLIISARAINQEKLHTYFCCDRWNFKIYLAISMYQVGERDEYNWAFEKSVFYIW